MLGICHNAEARGKDSFGGTDIPHRIARYQVDKKVALLIGEMKEFVPWPFYLVDFEWHKIFKDFLHHIFLFGISSKDHMGLEMASLQALGLILVKRGDISWIRCRSVTERVIKVE